MKSSINFIRYAIGTLLLGGALTLGLYGLSTINNLSFADNDDHRSHSKDRRYEESRTDTPTNTSPGTRMADASQYQEECGSCHIAYPAKLLPARSWHQIMTTLDDHYGDDASVDATQQAEILAYLSANSASNHSRTTSGVHSTSTPVRITELPYFKRKHHEVPSRMVEGNPKVGSFSQCDACHEDAANGEFDEDTVYIPGVGRWDD